MSPIRYGREPGESHYYPPGQVRPTDTGYGPELESGRNVVNPTSYPSAQQRHEQKIQTLEATLGGNVIERAKAYLFEQTGQAPSFTEIEALLDSTYEKIVAQEFLRHRIRRVTDNL